MSESTDTPPILFDQYSRYRAVAEVVQEIIGKDRATLLDVGSGSECLLDRLLPHCATTFVDPLLVGSEGPERIAATAHSPLLDDRRFDLVVSVDTLEHIPELEREAFVERLSQLARRGVVIAAPFSDAGDATAVDAEVNRIYRSVHLRDYPWLVDHFTYGLPSLRTTRRLLEGLGWECELVPNGHAWWLRSLLPLILVFHEIEELRPAALRLSAEFNRSLAPVDDVEPAYRYLIVARRPGSPSLKAARRKPDELEAARRWDRARDQILTLRFAGTAAGGVKEAERALRATLEEHDRQRVAWTRETLALRRELSQIQGSRLWRLAHRYWSLRRRLTQVRDGLGKAVGQVRKRSPASDSSALSRPKRRLVGPDDCRSYDLICLPIIDWDFRFQRPQQLCRRMARQGHRVFYVRTRFGRSSRSELPRWEDRVYDLELPAARPLNLYVDQLDEESLETALAALNRLRIETGDHPTVCLVQLPFWAPLAREARARWGWRLVYDCMDEHGGFSTVGPEMLACEEALVAEADLVAATARPLLEKVSQARRTLLLPNAADFDHFYVARSAERTNAERRPVIGYYGAIAEWFDAELVAEAARKRPEWRFILIGSTFGADLRSLEGLANVELLGERPYDELPTYLATFDVALIPFLRNELTHATNPVKFYEYLSAGKPVVAVSLPELEPYHDLFYPVHARDEFVPAIEAALAERNPALEEARIALARSETWDSRQSTLGASLAELWGEVAIVVVSHNNPEYLRLCLDSLRQRTLYPRYRVIVVDNASSEEVRDLLRERAAADPRVEVVYNDENLGFPRANNQGLELARDCEYMVLLNDDTIVTEAWLWRLVHRLEAAPSFGLVGPVTNWIGNEAQIPVPYRSVDGVERFARERARTHAGRGFDIPVLAMYCVAMRRSLLDEVGLLDEQFGIGMFEDDDFAKRVRAAGKRVFCAEDIFVHHWGKSSFRRLDEVEYQRLFEENRRRFEEKWGEGWRPHRHRPATGEADPNPPPRAQSAAGFEPVP